MVVSTRLVAAVMGGLLLATVYTPAWAGSANDTTTTARVDVRRGVDVFRPRHRRHPAPTIRWSMF